jgi:hypothetical protein
MPVSNSHIILDQPSYSHQKYWVSTRLRTPSGVGVTQSNRLVFWRKWQKVPLLLSLSLFYSETPNSMQERPELRGIHPHDGAPNKPRTGSEPPNSPGRGYFRMLSGRLRFRQPRRYLV